MKWRNLAVAVSLVLIGVALVRYQLTRVPTARIQDPRNYIQLGRLYEEARRSQYRAKLFNGSKRVSLPASQVSPEARQLAADYKRIIYPELKRFLGQYHLLPTGSMADHYDKEYFSPQAKEYIAKHPKWSTGESWRLDGTMICRDIYSHNPPDGPHDLWASYMIIGGRSPSQMLTIVGWDDGRVTFNTLDKCFQGTSHRLIGDMVLSAPPGAAGIPPGTPTIRQLMVPPERHSRSITKPSIGASPRIIG